MDNDSGFEHPLALLDFTLIPASSVSETQASLTGEPGQITQVSSTSFNILFPAGCVLGVEVTRVNSVMQIGRVKILDCKVNEPFVILLRRRLTDGGQPYFMIPGVLYGTNNSARGVVDEHPAGIGGDPKLDYRGRTVDREQCRSPAWHFRADRSSLPSVTATVNDQFVALGIREISKSDDGTWVYNGLGVWTSTEQGDSLTVTMGALDWPARIVRHRMQVAPVVEPLTKVNAVGMVTEFCLFQGPARDRFAYEPFLTEWYQHIHDPPRPGAALGQAMTDVADALLEDGTLPGGDMFHMSRDPRGIQPSATLLAWAGLLQIARPLLRVGRLLNEARYVEVAGSMVRRAVRDAIRTETGLFYDGYRDGRWGTYQWWPALGHTSLMNGHACYLLMKMAEDHPAQSGWAHSALQVLDRVLPHQRDDGRFPTGFSPTNASPTSYTGYAGCHFIAPLLMANRMFDNKKAGAAAERALEHYWTEFTNLEWIGADLDCRGAVDCGSSFPLIRALVEQHRQDQNSWTLDRLGHVLHYACSYRFGHNTQHRYPVCDWSSCGAQITSTHNVHIDAYGGEILEDMQYHLVQTGERYFQQRIQDSLGWARQAYNRTEGEYGWGKVGYVVEQLYHTYDSYQSTEVEPAAPAQRQNGPPLLDADGKVWVAYFPWAAGSLLNAFLVDAQQ